MTPEKAEKKGGWGGKRAGAGRKRKALAAATAIIGTDLQAALSAPVPDEVDSLAAGRTTQSIDALVQQMLYGESESAKIDAALEILDRGYGKPTVEAGADPVLPFLGRAPVRTIGNEIRERARRYATLAIEVLHKIQTSGTSESARVRAARAMLSRGLGTAAPAKVPAQFDAAARAGKKEERATRAEAAATGIYVTPAGPRTVQ